MSRSAVLSLAFALVVLPATLPVAAQTKYIAFGDSITEAEGTDDPSRPCPEDCGYPARLEDLLQNAGMPSVVVNAGLGGEATAEGLSRLDAVLAQEGGDVLLLMEGTNDVHRFISPETIVFNLAEMARRAGNRGLTTIHATLLPRVPDANVDPDNEVTQQVSWEVRELAYLRDRDLADPFEVFLNRPNAFAELYFAGSDPVGHPNAAGYDLMAGIFFDVIRGADSVPPVPGGLTPEDGASGVSSEAEVELRLFDFGAGIDVGATELLIDGAVVEAQKVGDSRILDLRYRPAGGFSGVIEVGYRTRDRAAAPNERERTLGSFAIEGTRFIPGDVNEDGRVDGVDLVELALRFGSVNGGPRYGRHVDLNRDDVIDGADLAILASNFGRSSG